MSKSKPSGRELQPVIHATFITRRNAPSSGYLLFWGPDQPETFDWTSGLYRAGLGRIPESHLLPAEGRLILPARDGRYKIETVQGRTLTMSDTIEVLGTANFNKSHGQRHKQTCASIIAWSYATKLALELIARQCFVPSLKTNSHELYAVWQAALESSVDIGRVRQLASMMPACAHALYSIPHNRFGNHGGPRRRRPTMMWHPEALLRAYIDTTIDAYVRKIMLLPESIEQTANLRATLSEIEQTPSEYTLEQRLNAVYGVSLAGMKAQIESDISHILQPAMQADESGDETESEQEPVQDAPEDAPDNGNESCVEDDSDEGDEEDETIGNMGGDAQPTNFYRSVLREISIAAHNGELTEELLKYNKMRLLHQMMPLKEYVHVSTAPFETLNTWESRWIDGLLNNKNESCMEYHLEDPPLVESIKDWLSPLHESDSTQELNARTGFWLEAPSAETHDLWFLRYMLVAVEDPSLAIPAGLVFSIGTERFRIEQHAFENPQEQLLTDLGRAAQYFDPMKASLEHSKPEGVLLDVKQAWTFISEVSPLLISEGFDVRLPEQLTDQGSRRLRARFRIRDAQPEDNIHGYFGLSDLAGFQWEAALGDEVVSAEEFKEIVALKQPLVQWHGSWVLVDPVQLRDIETLMDRNETRGTLTRFDAMNRALTGMADPNSPNSRIEVVVEGKIADVLERLTQEDIADMTMKAPPTFVGELRPYQERGVAWLSYQSRLGLGCCLADDMGLGKTIQLICHVLNQIQRNPQDKRGTLLICPMSVVGNWKREFARFAPSVHVVIHHGYGRAQSMAELQEMLSIPGTVVITTYGLIARSPEFMFKHHWAMIVLDEAQAIKNASSKRSMTVRELQADFRVALTGTPIENRLSELWSILDFLNPGLLGTNARFQRLYGIPIERNNDETAMERLRNLVSPFILRRIKSDPNIIQDLPDKMENKIYCTLTREQATMYQALVDITMKKIESAQGIARHGQVLALLTHLKQIVDHPALYQKDGMLNCDRSGKVQRLVEMLETILENGEKALIFTQYKEMGDVLVEILSDELGLDDIPFLHGSLTASQRDALVADFQSPDGPPIFILSLKAGGTGLNLTAATHVFHFDRWWNPAVEEQATDRAYRIGQDKNVQVHKFLTMGTLEEKIDVMLEEKKSLSDSIVDDTGAWVTQLDADALRELFTLSSDAMIDETD